MATGLQKWKWLNMQLDKLIQSSIKSELKEVHTSLPAKIESYNAEKMRARIVLLAKKEINGEENTIPPILEVPVGHIKFGSFILRPAYQKGDTVQVVFNEKAIDKLLITGDPESVELKRSFSLDDAVIVAGLKTEQDQDYPSSNTEDFLIYNTDTQEKIILKKSGGATIESNDIKLGSESATDALATKSELNDLKNLLLSHTHPYLLSTGSPSTTSSTTSIKPDYQGTQKVVAE